MTPKMARVDPVHGGTIARADVADFVVQQLTADTWLHKVPLITW